jgi:tetratricopeptide (TPR) repeat protein
MNTNVDLYNEILAAGPSPETLFLILSKMKEEGGYKRVIQECIKALMIYPSDILLRKLLAETYLADGQAAMAENEFLKVAGYIRDLISIYKSQARIYIKQKRDADAKRALKLYLAYCPGDEEAFDLLSSLPSTDELQEPMAGRSDRTMEGIPDYPQENMIDKDEQLPDIATPTLAEIYFRQGQVWDAKEMYEKIVMERPDDERLLRRLEELRELIGDQKTDGLPLKQPLTDPGADRVPEESAVHEPALEVPEKSLSTDPSRMKTKRIISVLEKWLEAIHESGAKPLPEHQTGLDNSP